jgi:pimeloyl-ACP methyl ester carboxylesterase
LMVEVLDYPRFAAHGGDWGAYVAARLAAAHAEKVLGIHLNLLPLRQDIPFPERLSDEHRTYQEELRFWQSEESAYSAIQGTKPQTLSYGLTDSPSGLAAWIVEKFHTWTDNRGNLERSVDLDSLLTTITLYWVTAAINSSFWPYYASRHEPWPLPDRYIEAPTAHASFPRETRHPPRSFAEQAFNIQRWTVMPRGGHFPALEVPDLLADDVVAFFASLRQS